MSEYVFEVRLRAVVRVRASNEEVAREVVPRTTRFRRSASSRSN
jgi:hypothetical protein